MRISAGEMDERIQIERETQTTDSMGGFTSTWAIQSGPMWAHVRPMTGAERERQEQVQSPAMYTVVIRNRSVNAKDRIKWLSNGNEILNIRYVAQDPKADFIAIECEGGVNQ